MTIVKIDEKFYEAFPVACYLLGIPKEELPEYAIIHSISREAKSYDTNDIRRVLEEILHSPVKEFKISSELKEIYGKDEKEMIKALIEADDDHLI